MTNGQDDLIPQAELERVRAYLGGDAEVFREVDLWVRSELRRRYPRLADEHEDLCQSVHARLVINLRERKYEGRSGLRAYVTGIAHHAAIDRLRGLYRDRALTEFLAGEAAAAVNPYRTTEALDEGKLLHQVLLSVPEMCRRLWRLTYLEKLPYEEIGRRLRVPIGTVKSRMYYCRRKATAALRRTRWLQRYGSRRPPRTDRD